MGIQDGLRLLQLKPTKSPKSAYVTSIPGEEIVITGMSGKFPDSDNVYHFRDNLFDKVDLVSGDYRRWKPIHPEVPQRTGKLNNVDKFDMGFFGVTKVQSDSMDPMTRMVLERVFEVLVDAGYHPFDLEGTNTGVFIGSCFSETEKFAFYSKQVRDADPMTGTQRSMLAKRISYFYKLNGSAFIADTACSSSLFALDHACKNLKAGICDKAIVCGTHLCLHPIVSLQFARLGVLSADGSCKSFDNAGNGYARSEAITAVLLEKSRDAKRIYAEIIHSKTNCDGYKEQGITYPSSGMQKVLMKEFYEECKVDPTSLTFVEAHGTGTKVGDPEELGTLDEIFCAGRNRPLYIGTIKSNIGHNEPASGLCSIVKVLIGMESGFIPPNINFTQPRKGVSALEEGRLKVVTEKMQWPDNEGLVGVNSFGFGGANAHVLLRWNPKVKINHGVPRDDLIRLVCVSGRTEVSVHTIFDDLCSRKLDAEFVKIIQQVFRRQIPGHLYRGFSIVSKEGEEIKRVVNKTNSIEQNLCVVFGNFDEKWFQVGKNLMVIPIFAGALQKIHDILQSKLKINITSILTNVNEENYKNQVIGTIALQLALVEVLKHINLRISNSIGIGFGELVASHLDNFLSIEEVLFIGYHLAAELERSSITPSMEKIERILCKKSSCFETWLPLYSKDQYGTFYPQGSVEYFLQNILRPIPLEEFQRSNPGKGDVLIIGGVTKKYASGGIVLLDSNWANTMNGFLVSLGSIYVRGIDMELGKLYPEVKYPVSRGTPMVSPLIKWYHDQSCVVNLYRNEEEKKSGQRVMHVAAKSEDWNFVTGHVVDGRNLFPATGYLVLVWESYAMMLGKLMSDMNVVFEDIKLVRAANVPIDGILSLRVMIQLGNNVFEIIEENSTLVTGNIYELDERHKLADLPVPVIDENHRFLTEKDVYKELKLRGYHYKNQFRAIKSCNLEGSNAVIAWTGNWITFMDNMLQLQLLQEDTRNLYVPTSIQKVIINGPRHIKCSHRYQNEIPTTYHRDLSLISAGGIEILGLGPSSIPRRKCGDPVLESYKFVPNESRLSEEDAVRCMVQVILENSNTVRVKAVEVPCEEYLRIPLVQQCLADLPLIQSELLVLNKKQIELPGVLVEDKSLSKESGCLLVMADNILENEELLDNALRATRECSGYLISTQPKTFQTESIKSTKVQVICSYETSHNTLLLLQEPAKPVERIPIDITNSSKDFAWINPVQNAIKSNEKLILYAENSCQDGILGFVNCLRREPNGNNVSAFILMDEAPKFDLKDEFYSVQLKKNMAINVWKDGNWGTYRHLLLPELQEVKSEHCYVNVTTRGDLSSLRWIEGPLSTKSPVDPEKMLVNVYYSAINFRDIMTASGRISADVITRDRVLQECVQGFEFSGRDSSGDRVMGMVTSGALSTLIMADGHLLWPVPDQWSLEDAATVPVVYGTVIYALVMRGNIKRGQSILIHSGTGGIGQAAINIARHYGCNIFTTVGTSEKKEFLKRHFPGVKEDHIGDSRSSSFEEMVHLHTNGNGVDFVLNSLAEEKLQASVRCLAYGGTFLEIGKFDLASDNKIGANLLKKQANFQGIMLDQLFVGSNDTKEKLAKLLLEGIRNKSVKPLVRSTFSSEEIETAFRYMATGKHIGKVLVKVREEEEERKFSPTLKMFNGVPRFSCKSECTYVVVGGLGGFGLELADWLVIRGARKLVLTSRTGIKNGYQSLRLKIFKTYGVTTLIRKDNIGSRRGCEDLLTIAEELGPIDAIFNLAVVLEDALFENQTPETFKTSLTPKAYATKNLDAVSRTTSPSLRYFVVFSSVTCGRGNAGQSNYGMANSIMERVCEQRKKDGYPGLSIQWGAIGEVGLVAEMQENHKELVIGGTLQQRLSSCLQVLDRFLRQEEAVVSSMVVAEKKVGEGASNIFGAVLSIIGITNLKAVSLHATFPELGMDSMMAVEIKQTLEREYEVFLTAQDIRSMTISKLKDLVSDRADRTPSKVQQQHGEELPEDIQMLFRYTGNETTSNIPLVHLETSVAHEVQAPMVFALAGIEGMAAVFEPMAKNLNAHCTCLQFCANNHSDTIESIAQPLVEIIESSSDDFTILAYSFGCVVATEVLRLLEKRGRIGRAFFVDGAPQLMTKLAMKYFPDEDEEVFQTGLLCILMSRYMSYDLILRHKLDILKHKTYEEKIRYVLSISPNVDHSEEYVIEMCKAGLNRLKALRNYEPKLEKLNSKITLARPSKGSLVEIAEDYNLASCTKRHVDVFVMDGNHVSILENCELAKEINKFVFSEREKDSTEKFLQNPVQDLVKNI